MILCPSVWFSYSSLAEKYQQQSWADLEKKIQKGISERVGSGSQMWREAEGADLGLKRSRVATGTWGQPTATSCTSLISTSFLSLRHFTQISGFEREWSDPSSGSLFIPWARDRQDTLGDSPKKPAHNDQGTQRKGLSCSRNMGLDLGGGQRQLTVTRTNKMNVWYTCTNTAFLFIYFYFLQCSLVFYSFHL